MSYIATTILLHQPIGSPFKVPVHDVTDASKVKCSGPGLSPGMVRANLPQSFQVDTSKAGVAPLQVKVQGPKGESSHTLEQGAMEASFFRASMPKNGLEQMVEGLQVTTKAGRTPEKV